jgi:hypothetical protein
MVPEIFHVYRQTGRLDELIGAPKEWESYKKRAQISHKPDNPCMDNEKYTVLKITGFYEWFC